MTDPKSSTDPSRAPALTAEEIAERRRHARVDLMIKARVLRKDGGEEPCLVVNISVGGALLKAKNPPLAGENVILYIDEVGRFEGRVIRSSKYSFAVDYRGRRAKSRRTADALTKALNNPNPGVDRRNMPRIRPDTTTIITLEGGETVECSILDISLTGASIEIAPQPPLGTLLTVGRMHAKVVRRHDNGVGVVFLGSAQRMEDVLRAADALNGTPKNGLNLAPTFGRKGSPA